MQPPRLRPFARFSLLAALAPAGCGSTPSVADEANGDAPVEVGRVRQRAGAWDLRKQTPPSPRPMPLRICIQSVDEHIGENEVNPALTDFIALVVYKQWVFDALAASWGTVPGVTFVDAGLCPTPSDMTINFVNSGSPDGTSGVCGLEGGCVVRVPDQVPSEALEPHVKGVAVHEVGHALGLDHEHCVPGAVLDPQQAAIIDGCNKCLDAAVHPTLCLKAHYNACFRASVASNQPRTPELIDRANVVLYNEAPYEDTLPLTVFDPMSVMSYYAGNHGRQPGDYLPTRLDLLGVEMLYPAARTYGLGCTSRCFKTGSGVILRSEGALTSEWTARGAVGVTMVVPPFGLGPVGETISASAVPLGASTFVYVFAGPRPGATLSGSGSVVKSNAAHTAVLMTTL